MPNGSVKEGTSTAATSPASVSKETVVARTAPGTGNGFGRGDGLRASSHPPLQGMGATSTSMAGLKAGMHRRSLDGSMPPPSSTQTVTQRSSVPNPSRLSAALASTSFLPLPVTSSTGRTQDTTLTGQWKNQMDMQVIDLTDLSDDFDDFSQFVPPERAAALARGEVKPEPGPEPVLESPSSLGVRTRERQEEEGDEVVEVGGGLEGEEGESRRKRRRTDEVGGAGGDGDADGGVEVKREIVEAAMEGQAVYPPQPYPSVQSTDGEDVQMEGGGESSRTVDGAQSGPIQPAVSSSLLSRYQHLPSSNGAQNQNSNSVVKAEVEEQPLNLDLGSSFDPAATVSNGQQPGQGEQSQSGQVEGSEDNQVSGEGEGEESEEEEEEDVEAAAAKLEEKHMELVYKSDEKQLTCRLCL